MDQPAFTLPQALNRAVSDYKAGKLAEAEQQCEQIVAANPDFYDALYVLAVVQLHLGKADAALAKFDRVLTLKPGHAMAHYNRGSALQDLKRYEEAVASYDRAIDLRPDYVAAYSNRGIALQKLKRFKEALASFDRALALRPDFSVVHYNRGNTLQKLKRSEEALASFDRAINLRPDFARAHFSRANALQELNRYEEALASFDRAIDLRPTFAMAHSDRGTNLHALKRYEEAVASYDRAIALYPGYAVAHYNRGLSLHELRRCEEAVASYEHAVDLQPNLAQAHLNQSLSRLLIADFSRGWQEYEWRMDVKSPGNSKRSFVRPQWQGRENISGKTILIHSEQGFGDTIQFCRYIPLVAERGARVILEVPTPLLELMKTVTGVSQIVLRGDPLPEFDIQCPLLSLPLAFGTRLETIPSAVPYLSASSESVTNWDAQLGPKHRPRIGLAWAGEVTHPNDRNRSIPLSALLSFLDIDATFVSLQKDIRPNDAAVLQTRSDLHHFGDELKNFADTAALISDLDLVISIDSSVAHLAGALAKPVWVLLTFVPDWRWLLNRDDSPWYPTARLFRQDETHAWDNVIPRIHAALSEFVQSRS
jgi:tetratricopeptide (TPR) repeat protein